MMGTSLRYEYVTNECTFIILIIYSNHRNNSILDRAYYI